MGKRRKRRKEEGGRRKEGKGVRAEGEGMSENALYMPKKQGFRGLLAPGPLTRKDISMDFLRRSPMISIYFLSIPMGFLRIPMDFLRIPMEFLWIFSGFQ